MIRKHMNISGEDIKAYNQRGWIPGPDEEEPHFLERTKRLDHFFSYPPKNVDRFLTDLDWEGAQKKTEELFDFSPDWIVAHYCDDQLSFFQGAATWISREGDLRIPLVQLKKKFEAGSLMRLYSRDEVLAHEAAHAARMQFDEPLFEEILAYKTSSKWWRRFFGPLFQKPWESYVFITLFLLPFVFQIAQFFWELPSLQWLNFLPVAFVAFLVLRLTTLQILLLGALKKLGAYIKEKRRSLAAAFRLTDKEIIFFATRSEKECQKYIAKEKSLRWRALKKIYFK